MLFNVTYRLPYDASDKPKRTIAIDAINERFAIVNLKSVYPNAENVNVEPWKQQEFKNMYNGHRK